MQYDPNMANHPLAEAARYNDAAAEEHGFQPAIKQMGLDLEPLAYVAHQRALRAVMLTTRGEEYMRQYAGSPMPHVVPLSANERQYVDQLTAVLIDGIAIGWKAARLNE